MPWFKNPQTLIALISVATMVLGFFYVRERQLWEHGRNIDAIENRGQTAIMRVDDKLTEMEKMIYLMKDRIDVLEYKMNNKHE